MCPVTRCRGSVIKDYQYIYIGRKKKMFYLTGHPARIVKVGGGLMPNARLKWEGRWIGGALESGPESRISTSASKAGHGQVVKRAYDHRLRDNQDFVCVCVRLLYTESTGGGKGGGCCAHLWHTEEIYTQRQRQRKTTFFGGLVVFQSGLDHK